MAKDQPVKILGFEDKSIVLFALIQRKAVLEVCLKRAMDRLTLATFIAYNLHITIRASSFVLKHTSLVQSVNSSTPAGILVF